MENDSKTRQERRVTENPGETRTPAATAPEPKAAATATAEAPVVELGTLKDMGVSELTKIA